MTSTNDPKYTPLNSTSAQISILVLISARAIGSVGFAVSLLAVWFGWLLPASLAISGPSDISEIKKPRHVSKHHRRSVSSPTRTPPISTPTQNSSVSTLTRIPPVRQNSAPVDLAPILVPHPEGNVHDSSRRVSFADSSLSPAIRRNTMPEPKKSNIFLPVSVSTFSRHSSSSPLRPETPPNRGLDDLNAQDSDSSMSKPSRLQKLKLGFNLKINRHPTADKQSDRDSIASIESTTSELTAKRTSGVFVAAWSNSRVRTARDEGYASPSRSSFVRLLSPSTPTTSTTFTPASPGPTDVLSPTSLCRKAERRSSAPIPRTHPYGAPYFASPPVSLHKNTYSSYLKGPPQFEDEVQFSSARASERGREPATILRAPLNPGRRVIAKRGSASEDWTVRPPTES